jgi:hypothetical protein
MYRLRAAKEFTHGIFIFKVFVNARISKYFVRGQKKLKHEA